MAAVSLAPMLPAINFSTTTVAVLAVAAVLCGVYVVIKAVQYILTVSSGRVFYGGQSWDIETYETALREVKQRARRGELVDAESRRAVADYEGRKSSRSLSTRIPSTRI